MKTYDLTKEPTKEPFIDELLSYQGKWRVLHITHKGGFWGAHSHDTEGSAQNSANEWLDKVEKRLPQRSNVKVNGVSLFMYPDDHIATIPMPVGD